MIYFLYGQDSYRSKRKLDEIVDGYKKVHTSGLNLIIFSAKNAKLADFLALFKSSSMFSEKKLIIMKDVFSSPKFTEDFVDEIKEIANIKDIVVIYENESTDKRLKIFKSLLKYAKCQEFDYLSPALLKKWVVEESNSLGGSIDSGAADLLISYVKNDLWRLSNEIKKLVEYKNGKSVTKIDIDLLIKPSVENDIFKTIDALASKNKKLALSLLHKHLESGDEPLYLLSMIAYQIKNLLIIKELINRGDPSFSVAKKSGLHPFVVQKTLPLCKQFSYEELKNIYNSIFLIDEKIKVGKLDAESALEMLLVRM